MTREQNYMNAKAEVILMGITQPVVSNEEAIYIVNYIAKVLNQKVTGEEIFEKASEFTKNPKIKYVNISALGGMALLCLSMTTDDDTEEFDILDPNGVFSYVYNFTYPDLSELGYCFFEKKPQGISRVG